MKLLSLVITLSFFGTVNATPLKNIDKKKVVESIKQQTIKAQKLSKEFYSITKNSNDANGRDLILKLSDSLNKTNQIVYFSKSLDSELRFNVIIDNLFAKYRDSNFNCSSVPLIDKNDLKEVMVSCDISPYSEYLGAFSNYHHNDRVIISKNNGEWVVTDIVIGYFTQLESELKDRREKYSKERSTVI